MLILRVSVTTQHSVHISVDGTHRLKVGAGGTGELALGRPGSLQLVFEGESGTHYSAEFQMMLDGRVIQTFTTAGVIELSGKSVASERVFVRRTVLGVSAGETFSFEETVNIPTSAPDPDNAEYTVFYGTNRARIDEVDPSRGYSGERGKRIDYGSCRVFIPKSHKIGSLGSAWWKRLITVTDDRLKLLEIRGTSAEAHWQEMSERLAKLADDDREGVVFVHGYNVTFEEAALRAAQIGFDLSIKGAMAFFSWPSQGTLRGYPADEATIDVSEDAIESYLSDFAVRSGARRVHLIAHSMGNRGVMRTIHRIASAAHGRTGVPFDQIILAAADVDADKFRSLAAAYTQVARRTTLYVSEKDRAVEASHWLHRFPRLGFTPPVFVMDKMDTVSVSNIDLTLLGHGYVGAARDVLKDMHELIRHGTPPEKRFGLKEAKTDEGERYWLIGA